MQAENSIGAKVQTKEETMKTKGIDRIVIAVKDMDRAIELFSKVLGIEFEEIKDPTPLETANVRLSVGHVPQQTKKIHLEIIQPLYPLKDSKPPFTIEMAESLKHVDASLFALLFRIENAAEALADLESKGVRIFRKLERDRTVVGGTNMTELVTEQEDTLGIKMAFVEYQE
jgi:catechol 2,3-dioxygenase-like lactoylglutathione lyase family enzyme